ncbi:MAG: lamin tail domain-containing protein, partial [Patescibacteria group bacterium]
MAVFFIAPKMIWAQVIINEIMYDLPSPGTDDKHEWVEIYNNGASPVDLTDYKFNDGDTATNHSLNIPPKNSSRGSMTLDAGGYALLAGDAATLIADLPNYIGTIIDTVINLSNTSATLKLLDKDGIEIASTAYNKDMGAAGNANTLESDGAGLKESLVDGGTPGLANSILSSSATPSPTLSGSPAPASAATASPTPTPGYQYSQKVFINEFLPWPASDDKEWVELVNSDNTTF